MAGLGGAAAFTRIRQILEHTLCSSPTFQPSSHPAHSPHSLPALDKFFLQFNAYTNWQHPTGFRIATDQECTGKNIAFYMVLFENTETIFNNLSNKNVVIYGFIKLKNKKHISKYHSNIYKTMSNILKRES